MSSDPTNDNMDEDKKKMPRKRHYYIGILILSACGLIGTLFFVGFIFDIPSFNTDSQFSDSDQYVKISSIIFDDAKIRGNSSALVTLVDFSDFGCPFCQRYATSIFPQIVKDYVDTNKIKYAFMQFPLEIHPNAKSAAIASECANDQGKFWSYHDILYSTQPQWKSLSGSDAAIYFKKYAVDLKLDSSKFNSCFDTNKYDRKITSDIQTGSKYVTGTPTFYIGNNKKGYVSIEGSQPVSTFQKTIDRLLKSS